MIKIIADSGSTKTDWAVCFDNKIEMKQTLGMNPYSNSQEALNRIVSDFHSSIGVKEFVSVEIHFYGAGCSSEESKSKVASAIRTSFQNAKIIVEHDLLAAARAVCGTSSGLVAILGTGSNTCLYDGCNILANRKALGYVLGDEGSGAYIGKRILRDYLNEEMNHYLTHSFKSYLCLSTHEIFQKVYQEPQPNRFLASLTRWASEHRNENYVQNVIAEAFEDLFQKHITKYRDYHLYELNVIGSIGFVFKEELKKVADKYQTTLGNVIKSPIDGLIEFHL